MALMKQLLFDQYSIDLQDKDVAALALHDSGNHITVDDLDRTHRDIYPKEVTAAAKVGFLAKLFSGNGKVIQRGLIEETKWYAALEVDGKVFHYGAAVRLAVAATSIQIEDFSVSLPNISAAAQLGFTEARAGIYTVGFGGFPPTLMPDKLDFSVENFTDFRNVYNQTVAHVFAVDNRHLIKPTLLMALGE
ncbi:hypothetical protein KM176_24525 [Pseudooceanicola sp. CBS1P-1]|uniref:Uncharacterized protein n=1 Tax=Pseudooceanicola albus TaxID=2692189 RepID=A0A6L7GD56_9RHOB|nr:MULTISPECIES: hypothetical protein [Pseudooceanicola]MBT9387029.1 hypothetical protein [Pseudooceanicola endophyticus]MXN21170.1 hypothetical protein [Pseudooceanicola albus]